MPKKAAKSPFRDFPAKDWFIGHPHNSQERAGRWYDFDSEDDVPGGWWTQHCPRNLTVLAEFLADGLRRFRDAPNQPEYTMIDKAAPGGSHVPFPDPVEVFNRLFWGLAHVQLANVWLDHHGANSHDRPTQPRPVEWPREVSPLATSVERQMVYRDPLTEPERRMLESEIPRVDRELSELWRWVANRAGGELPRANDTQGELRSDQAGDVPKDTVSTVPALHAHEPKHDRIESESPHLEPALTELPQQAADRLERQDEPAPVRESRPEPIPETNAQPVRRRRGTRQFDHLAICVATLELMRSGESEATAKTLKKRLDGWDDARISKAAKKLLEATGQSFDGQPLKWLSRQMGDPDALRGMMTAGTDDGDFSPDIEIESRLPE